MQDVRRQIALLGALHELEEPDRVIAFRQGMASLAQIVIDPAAVPFEGFDQEPLLASVSVALADRLFDSLEFLSEPAAASALYAMAAALPASSAERRELGRRVRLHLAQGNGRSFVALGTALAFGSTRGFQSSGVRARLSLVVLAPASASVCADPLAFALLARPELAESVILEPATGDLPSRRLAARLVERAARYAALRARQGDDGALASFEAAPIQTVFAQLLGDREPLVFRHAAGARGLLAGYVARYAEDLERDLMATTSLSRVRRGATSLAARVAVQPSEALRRVRELLAGPLPGRDPGLAAALIHGLAHPVEVEPEAAEELLLLALERGGSLGAEALLGLRRELQDEAYCPRATPIALQQLSGTGDAAQDPSQLELVRLLREALERTPRDAKARRVSEPEAHEATLPQLVGSALIISARVGPTVALESARRAAARAEQLVERLAALEPSASPLALRESLRLLYELDVGLLESSALFELLAAEASEGGSTAPALTGLLARLLSLLVTQEEVPHQGEVVPLLALRMARLRTLLHLLDTDMRVSPEQAAQVRAVQRATVRKLCARVAKDASSPMDRVVHAALARGVEALVRGEALELADVVLCLANAVPLPEGMLAVAEGCLLPDLKRALRALFGLMQSLEPQGGGPRAVVAALGELSHVLPGDESPRTEALRRALLGLWRALDAILAARSIRELLGSRRVLTLFESVLGELAHLTRGAQRQLGVAHGGAILDASPVAGLARALESSAVPGGELADLGSTLDWLDGELLRVLPAPLAHAVASVLASVRKWPLDGREAAIEPLTPAAVEICPLPSWMQPSRRLGGFFVVRPLAAGLASSVFLVKRSEQRAEPHAPGLVLKVPRYDAHAARVLSETSFEEHFAHELPALLTVPPHENLASFVSIETAHHPKPFMVMEWVEGPTLARVRKRKLDALAVLDGILAGLEVLHGLGIGHLDVNPSHVILRSRAGLVQPVLVDFGLAGRNVRPGCGHASYSAPELWTGAETTPMAMDIYAIGCLAYELSTGCALFQGVLDRQLAAAHASHDGVPRGIAELAGDARTAALASWIALCLRGDPAQRASATQLRKGLKPLRSAP